MTSSNPSHPASLHRHTLAALLCLAFAVLAPTVASADPYADIVISGPANAIEALGACDGVAVDLTGSQELIVAFADNYLVNPDDSPPLDGRAIGLGGQECAASFSYASDIGPPFFDWVLLDDPMDWNLTHGATTGDFQFGVPYFYVRLEGPPICEDGFGSPLPTPIDCIETLNPVTLIDADADGADDRMDNCVGTPNPSQSDGDDDAVGDACDNCLTMSNGPFSACGQTDSDDDGFGNLCDSDFNNDGGVGFDDLTVQLSYAGGSTYPSFDTNCDGGVGFDDITETYNRINQVPGPSGLTCAGTVPCTAP